MIKSINSERANIKHLICVDKVSYRRKAEFSQEIVDQNHVGYKNSQSFTAEGKFDFLQDVHVKQEQTQISDIYLDQQ